MPNESVWKEFGFSDNPYRVTPLEPNAEDEKLFTRRDKESSQFLTDMDCKDGCVVVVSGDAGIGKTSFVNIQQHLMEIGLAGFGPTLLACRKRTPLWEDRDNNTIDPISLARRVVENALGDIEIFCNMSGKKLPSEANRVRDWLSSREATSGYQIGIAGMSFGRTMMVPPVADASLETWCTVLESLAMEARDSLKVDGLTVCLDNAESVPFDELSRLLMIFRDTFFICKGVWWIVIGQSGLYWKIESRDRRLSQRIRGKGVELRPLNAEGFHDVIQRRVQFYRSKESAVSPLSEEIHAKLFEAGRGEVRFALDTADILISHIVARVRTDAAERLGKNFADARSLKAALQAALRSMLIDSRIPETLANTILSELAIELLKPRQLDEETVGRLIRIGSGSVTAKQYAELGLGSEEECVRDFLGPMREHGILARDVIHGRDVYRLKGFAKLSHDFNQMEKIAENAGA